MSNRCEQCGEVPNPDGSCACAKKPSQSEALLPCPFCGGKPRINVYPITSGNFSEKYSVLCEYTGLEQGCGAEGQHNKVLEVAIESWNTRHNPTPPSPDDSTLGKAIEELAHQLAFSECRPMSIVVISTPTASILLNEAKQARELREENERLRKKLEENSICMIDKGEVEQHSVAQKQCIEKLVEAIEDLCEEENVSSEKVKEALTLAKPFIDGQIKEGK